jgi:fucose permease
LRTKNPLQSQVYSRLLLSGSFIALLGFAVSANTIPPLISTIGRDLNQPFGLFGVLISIQYTFFALASFTGGFLEVRIRRGNLKLVLAGLFLLGAALFAASGFRSINLFLLWAIPFGFAGGLVETFSSVIISNHSSSDSSKLLVLSQVFYCLGAFLAPQAVAVLLNHNWQWQSIFQIISCFIVITAVAFIILTQRKSAALPGVSDERLAGVEEQRPFGFDIMFFLTAFLLFLYVVAELISICWIPLFFETRFSLNPAASAWRSALLWTGFIAGRVFVLVLPGKWTMKPAAFASATGMLIVCWLIHLSDAPIIAAVFVFMFGFFAGPLWPVIVMLARKAGNNDTFTSGVIGIGALGAALGPSLGSIIIKNFSIENIFLFVSFICLLMLAAMSYYCLICAKRDSRAGL